MADAVKVRGSTVQAEFSPVPDLIANKIFPRFLSKFIQIGKEVADYIIRAGLHAGADRALKTYAAILANVWSDSFDLLDESSSKVQHLDSAYFTIRSFLELANATTVSSRRAKARGESALEAVADYLGEESVWRIEEAVQKELGSKRVRSLGGHLKGGPASLLAWSYIAGLPKNPPMPFKPFLSGEVWDRLFLYGPGVGERPPGEEKDIQVVYDVWYGTNRLPVDPANYSLGFSNEADPTGKVHYGICSVNIPPIPTFGSVGTSFLSQLRKWKFADDHYKISGFHPITSDQEFVERIRKKLGLMDESERVVLVYIHGYNNSFKASALRAAQIGFDLKIPGVTALYSWPSHAHPLKYLPDRERIEASEKQIAKFLTTIVTHTKASKVHVIAHSMGNRGFVRALPKVLSNVAASGEVKFGQIILAAADLGKDLFTDLASNYPKLSDRTTLYISAKDKALRMARFLQDAARIGFKPPVTVVDGIDTVDAGNIDLTLLGHGYIAEAAPVLYDMKTMISDNVDPANRARMREAFSEDGKRYWIIYA